MRRIVETIVVLVVAAPWLCETCASAQSPAVEIRQQSGGYRLYRAGKPYYVKGAVFWADPNGRYPLSFLNQCGANSVRSGGRHLENILDAADRLDMTVTVGLLVAHEFTDKFDYNDANTVASQHQRIVETVKKYKDHPALLMWGLGNEWSYGYKNEKAFDAVEAACKAAYEIDGRHPTMTAVGDNPFDANFIGLLKKKCPHLDVLGVNMYGSLTELPAKIREIGWDKPYIVTEWGPNGYWQVEETAWKSEIEETSSEKAAVYRRSYEEAILKDKERCLGSYVFLWGQKQEHTHTWFGMFLDTGERTEVVGVMQYLWTGRWPDNRAPTIGILTIEGRRAADSVYLTPGSRHSAKVSGSDPDGDAMRFEWEILPEPKSFGYAGRGERKPAAIAGLVEDTGDGRITFLAPQDEGKYRLVVTIFDGHNNAATANIPFRVVGDIRQDPNAR